MNMENTMVALELDELGMVTGGGIFDGIIDTVKNADWKGIYNTGRKVVETAKDILPDDYKNIADVALKILPKEL